MREVVPAMQGPQGCACIARLCLQCKAVPAVQGCILFMHYNLLMYYNVQTFCGMRVPIDEL